ncbi:alpha/beta fold hydrolase [Nonomuraea terrae]|uniref:Alpha/beta fold hydrolase n=1 Tax=Nonomuraea terrae TaxID=2530383 RepID=A0A4R4YY17_9ACTN|nr:alpha/beta fold hydrolase [Nonomuraea terrae]
MQQTRRVPDGVRVWPVDAGRYVRLAYVDSEGTGHPILALHGAFGRGRVWMTLAEHLGPDWRVIGLDQRGHGLSDEPGDYGREAFLADTTNVIETLGSALRSSSAIPWVQSTPTSSPPAGPTWCGPSSPSTSPSRPATSPTPGSTSFPSGCRRWSPPLRHRRAGVELRVNRPFSRERLRGRARPGLHR